MPTINVLPQGTYAIGTRAFGPAALAQGLTTVELALDGSAMLDPALQLTVQLDLSLDNGVTWASTNRGPSTDPFPVTIETRGGSKDRFGNPRATYTLATTLPQPQLATRQVRGTLTIAGTPLTTSGTLTLT